MKTSGKIIAMLVCAGSTYTASLAYTVNGKELKSLIQPGEDLVVSIAETAAPRVGLIATKDTLKIGAWDLPKDDLEIMKNVFTDLTTQISGEFSSRTLRMSSPLGNYQGGKFTATGSMVFGCPGATLMFAETLLESPTIELVGRSFDCYFCYLMSPKVLRLISAQEDALIQFIEVVFDEKAIEPAMISGQIDLVSGESERMVFVGAREVSITFHSKLLQ